MQAEMMSATSAMTPAFQPELALHPEAPLHLGVSGFDGDGAGFGGDGVDSSSAPCGYSCSQSAATVCALMCRELFGKAFSVIKVLFMRRGPSIALDLYLLLAALPPRAPEAPVCRPLLTRTLLSVTAKVCPPKVVPVWAAWKRTFASSPVATSVWLVSVSWRALAASAVCTTLPALWLLPRWSWAAAMCRSSTEVLSCSSALPELAARRTWIRPPASASRVTLACQPLPPGRRAAGGASWELPA